MKISCAGEWFFHAFERECFFSISGPSGNSKKQTSGDGAPPPPKKQTSVPCRGRTCPEDVRCSFPQPLGARQKGDSSAKICENVRSGSGFSLLLSPFWRALSLERETSSGALASLSRELADLKRELANRKRKFAELKRKFAAFKPRAKKRQLSVAENGPFGTPF